VRLEVLDWGGTGEPLVLLAGLGDVGHGFDDFAPPFTDRFHVLAITRRGYGASSQPPGGYDLATRVQDLRTALDSLHLSRVNLVGHSIAGDELTAFAGAYPDRVARLIYFDAAYDHSEVTTILRGYPMPPDPQPADSASPAAQQAYNLRVSGVRIPEAQFRATEVFGPDGKLQGVVTPSSIDSLVLAGTGHPDYAKVRAPALAIYAVADSAPQIFPFLAAASPAVQAKARAYLVTFHAWAVKERDRFRRNTPHGRVVELHGANHYVFFSNQAEVVKEMRSFLESKP
jgi:pimeloyl-ACP methyl ester carboxylesterase